MWPAVVDHNGGMLTIDVEFEVTRAGYAQLLEWMSGFGALIRVGVEGTGSYGVDLVRHLAGEGVEVVEVDRPDRVERSRFREVRSGGPRSPATGRAALSRRAAGKPKGRNGTVEAMRVVGRREALRPRDRAHRGVVPDPASRVLRPR